MLLLVLAQTFPILVKLWKGQNVERIWYLLIMFLVVTENILTHNILRSSIAATGLLDRVARHGFQSMRLKMKSKL